MNPNENLIFLKKMKWKIFWISTRLNTIRKSLAHRVKSSVWYASTAVQCRDIWLMAVEQHQFYLDKRQASRVRYIFFTNILITVYSTMLFWRDYFELGRIKNNLRFTSYIIQKHTNIFNVLFSISDNQRTTMFEGNGAKSMSLINFTCFNEINRKWYQW